MASNNKKRNSNFYLAILSAPVIVPVLSIYFWEHVLPFMAKNTPNDNDSLWKFASLLGLFYSIFAVREIADASKHYQLMQDLSNNHKNTKSKEKYRAKKRFKISRAMHLGLLFLATMVLILVGMVTYDNHLIGRVCVGFWSCAVSLVYVIAKQLENPLESIFRLSIPEEWDLEDVPISAES